MAKAHIEQNKTPSPEILKNPYYGWDKKRLDCFLIALAKVAGKGNKVPIAGVIKTHIFNRIKAELEIDNPEQIQLGDDPYKYTMGEFFQVYHRETFYRWGNFKCPVTFFFDRSDDPKWIAAVREVYGAFDKKDLRMKGLSFVDKKSEAHLPLQAADMLAYRLRKVSDKLASNSFDLEEQDKLLLSGLFKSVANANPQLAALLKRKTTMN